METELDVSNRFNVQPLGSGKVIITKPPVHELTREDALVLAAWLVRVANSVPLDQRSQLEFGDVLEDVEEQVFE